MNNKHEWIKWAVIGILAFPIVMSFVGARVAIATRRSPFKGAWFACAVPLILLVLLIIATALLGDVAGDHIERGSLESHIMAGLFLGGVFACPVLGACSVLLLPKICLHCRCNLPTNNPYCPKCGHDPRPPNPLSEPSAFGGGNCPQCLIPLVATVEMGEQVASCPQCGKSFG